jgi:hypothetical protein
LLNDEVAAAAVLQPTHNNNVFARVRVMRVSDQNVKRLFLGSMSSSRKER